MKIQLENVGIEFLFYIVIFRFRILIVLVIFYMRYFSLSSSLIIFMRGRRWHTCILSAGNCPLLAGNRAENSLRLFGWCRTTFMIMDDFKGRSSRFNEHDFDARYDSNSVVLPLCGMDGGRISSFQNNICFLGLILDYTICVRFYYWI